MTLHRPHRRLVHAESPTPPPPTTRSRVRRHCCHVLSPDGGGPVPDRSTTSGRTRTPQPKSETRRNLKCAGLTIHSSSAALETPLPCPSSNARSAARRPLGLSHSRYPDCGADPGDTAQLTGRTRHSANPLFPVRRRRDRGEVHTLRTKHIASMLFFLPCSWIHL